ncbi:MAG: response regulator [Xenococcaceae cyanobacterium MO_188.B32]|nr:response regulator [Xenococcaceae cyanobacterium MO_188.B32]
MDSTPYQAQQLSSLLKSQQKSQYNGTLFLETTTKSWQNQRSCVLIWRQGEIVYGGAKVPSNQELAQTLGNKLKPDLVNAALGVAKEKIPDSKSVRELVAILIRMRLFTWEQVENLIQNWVILTLEKFLAHPGQAQWDTSTEFDLSYGEDKHGLDWSKLRQELALRQQKWANLAPLIPSMDAIPLVTQDDLIKITDVRVREHCQKWVDGRRAIVDIAAALNKDPLKIAQTYLQWLNAGWISFDRDRSTLSQNRAIQANKDNAKSNSNSIDTKELPLVLSVDDSPIVQTTIKRALSDRYNVFLASKATEALSILNQKPIQLLLLDLTMPDTDGLEFCQTIRKIPKFRHLPIIMVTARDGLVDKMKGHIAGTNKYLTKPFKPEELVAMVDKYIYKS